MRGVHNPSVISVIFTIKCDLFYIHTPTRDRPKLAWNMVLFVSQDTNWMYATRLIFTSMDTKYYRRSVVANHNFVKIIRSLNLFWML